MNSSFTEHVLERAKERQQRLQTNFKGTSVSHPSIPSAHEYHDDKPLRKDSASDPMLKPSNRGSPSKTILSSQNSKTCILSTSSCGSPMVEYNEINIQRENFNMEIKFNSTDNVRFEVEIDSVSDNENDGDSVTSNESSGLRDKAKNRLQRLGKLYAGDEDLSSPIHRTEEQFKIEETDYSSQAKENKPTENRSRKGLGKLADLAKDINQWEDDITPRRPINEKKDPVPKRHWKSPAPQPPQVATKVKPPAPKPPISSKKPDVALKPQQLNWDPDVIHSLEHKPIPTQTLIKEGKEPAIMKKTSPIKEATVSKNTSPVKETRSSPVKLAKTKESVNTTESTITTRKFVPLSTPKEENKVTPRVNNKKNAIASKAAMFEKAANSSPVKKEKDPALLSVSERKALFEVNRGNPVMPKVVSTKPKPEADTVKTRSEAEVVNPKGLSGVAAKIALLNKQHCTISQEQIENKVKEDRQKEMEVLMSRFNKNKNIVNKENEHESESDDDDDQHEVSETTAMINFKSPKVVACAKSPTPPPLPSNDNRRSGEKRSISGKKGDSPIVKAVLGDVKRIKVTQPKDGELYPCLSDIEATTETETDPTVASTANNSLSEYSYGNSDDGNTSFGREIMEVVCNNQSAQRVMETSGDNSDSDLSDVLEDMDEYLNQCDDDDQDDVVGPSPPKNIKLLSPEKNVATKPSESFSYKNYNSPIKQHYTPNNNRNDEFKSPCKPSIPRRRESEEFPIQVMDGSDILPLKHTVSFYRKQQAQPSKTPVKHIIRQAAIEEDESDKSSPEEEVALKIKELTEDVSKQQMIISQTSRALNLCNSTPEFSGSTEQVEAEKVLLLATHRRQAATLEIQRLKVEGTLRPIGTHPQNTRLEKGTVTISDVVLPLKKEYVRALAAAGGKGHHVVCLAKSGEKVLATQIASTVASSPKNPDLELMIPGQIRLDDIHSDFTIIFEVYCLRAQEEILPHEVKYHINKKGNNKSTPKKKQDSRLVRPPKESPAGPQAVRSPTFALHGYVIFSIHAINKTSWTLNKIPPISPLEGSVLMKIKCELDISVEMKGFLNMFEDVSGFGAWHRRWCSLKVNIISFWKYPEDERTKAPIDTIDLKSCVTQNVGPVTRDICARLNTFLLERERPVQPNDKKTLTVETFPDKTVIKHLLSADSKEERIEWCENLNKALSAMRMWGHTSD